MTFGEVAGPTVLMGNYIPAHDQTFDLAQEAGNYLDAFQSYVAQVREPEQAKNAVIELLRAFLAEAEKP